MQFDKLLIFFYILLKGLDMVEMKFLYKYWVMIPPPPPPPPIFLLHFYCITQEQF